MHVDADITVHNHHHHGNHGNGDDVATLLAAILAQLMSQGATLSDIQAAIDAQNVAVGDLTAAVALLPSKIAEDVENFQAIIAQLTAELSDALANDQADAATIAEKQALIDDLTAQAQAAVDSITANTSTVASAANVVSGQDPDPSNPPAPPVSPPVDSPPVDDGGAVDPTEPPAQEGFRGRRT